MNIIHKQIAVVEMIGFSPNLESYGLIGVIGEPDGEVQPGRPRALILTRRGIASVATSDSDARRTT